MVGMKKPLHGKAWMKRKKPQEKDIRDKSNSFGRIKFDLIIRNDSGKSQHQFV